MSDSWGWPRLRLMRPWLASQPSILRARGLRVLRLPGLLVILTPWRHWSHDL